jgi:hypothetical protein
MAARPLLSSFLRHGAWPFREGCPHLFWFSQMTRGCYMRRCAHCQRIKNAFDVVGHTYESHLNLVRCPRQDICVLRLVGASCWFSCHLTNAHSQIVAEVDCAAHPSICNKAGVQSYPALHFYAAGSRSGATPLSCSGHSWVGPCSTADGPPFCCSGAGYSYRFAVVIAARASRIVGEHSRAC